MICQQNDGVIYIRNAIMYLFETQSYQFNLTDTTKESMGKSSVIVCVCEILI